MYNQPKILEYLLKTVKTFKNDSKNKLGRTALNIAASQGAFECINILLNNLKCNINSTDKVCSIYWNINSLKLLFYRLKYFITVTIDYLKVNVLNKLCLFD